MYKRQGVHALGQVASFELNAPIPPENFQRALNRTLPSSIRVLEATIMPHGFHARHSTVAKIYEYRVWIEKRECVDICPPFLARYVFTCPWNLERSALDAAAKSFLGEHDFASFAATDPDLTTRREGIKGDDPEVEEGTRSTTRTIFSSAWHEHEGESGPILIYRVQGNGFLHHMVRNLVGTMIQVGRGALKSTDIAAILEARERSAAGPTAPARGLFLHSVQYD